MHHGERERYEEMYRRHHRAIYGYALRRVPDETTAQDVASEVFMTAWRRRRVWLDMPEDEHLPWLYGVARNVVGNAARSRNRSLALSLRLHQDEAVRGGGVPDTGDQVTDRLAAAAAFDSLGPKDQEVLRLVAWEGLTARQIGQVLGLREATVLARISRARRRLDAALAGPRAVPVVPSRERRPSVRRATDIGGAPVTP